MWAQECNVCLQERDKFLINFCECTSHICESCYNQVKVHSSYNNYVCVTCRTPEKKNKTLFSDYRPRPNLSNNIFIDFEMVDVLAERVVPPTDIITTTLTESQVKRAKRNWHYWFERLRGHEIVRPYIRQGSAYMQCVHQLLNTGRFKYIDEAGVCVHKEHAHQYVQSQLAHFV